MTMQGTKIYLAGPEVFLPDALALGAEKKALCAKRGLVGLFPFDNEIGPKDAKGRVDLAIYRANAKMIIEADCGIFNLTPFRGPSADVGTVFELGMMTGLGKPCFAYTNSTVSLLERIRLTDIGAYLNPDGRWYDTAGLAIEDFGNSDNLMIDCSLEDAGRSLVRVQVGEAANVLKDLRGFEICLDLVTSHIARSRRDIA